VVHTNADGRFHFDHVVRGESALRIEAASLAPTVVTLKAAAQCDAGTIVVGPGGEVEVEIVAATGDPSDVAAESIHVVRSEDGAPLLDWASGHGRGAVERLSNPQLTSENAVRWTSSTQCVFALPRCRATLDLVAGKDRRFSRELDVVAGRTLHVKLE
jgi:hypothetical protein